MLYASALTVKSTLNADEWFLELMTRCMHHGHLIGSGPVESRGIFAPAGFPDLSYYLYVCQYRSTGKGYIR